jgi:import inner membrane translocase subunit TIM44
MSFALVTRRRNSSFIKNVMEQVKKEVDSDPKMKKAWEEFAKKKEKSESKFQGFSMPKTNPISGLKDNPVLERSFNAVKDSFIKAASATQPIREKLQSVQMGEKLSKLSSNPAVDKIRAAGSVISSKLSAASSRLGLDESSEKRAAPGSMARWRAVRDATVQQEAAERAREEVEKKVETGEASVEELARAETAAAGPGDGLVVSDRGSSSWDRFGARMSDMPFLNAFFSNPLMDSLFGETEISASIRQMRDDVDPNFSLEEFCEEIESVVAPRFIEWYLTGEAERLRLHCGEAAYAAVNASIDARRKQGLCLDTNVLSGPSEFELKAAKSSSAGESAAGASSPLFVFTFNCQQINCLRDSEGSVVEGAVDDIRQLFYAIAVQRHPKATSSSELEFPWQIQDIAILGNQPCW